MNSIPQNVLILLGCIIVAAIVLGVFGFYAAKAPLQRQVIHIFDEQYLRLSNPDGLITISDIKPNSAVSFYYSDPDRYKNRDPFEQFLLIRLPDTLGGTVNDASAFRAYSALDPTSHCLLQYWPQEGRRQVEDACSGSMYEPMFGHVTIFSGHSVLTSAKTALPYLDISIDENGFLYAEPPIWTEHQNGVVGIGRAISEKEIQQANHVAAAREKQFSDALEKFRVPEQFSTGHKLDHIGTDGIRTNLAEYFNSESSIMLFYSYCNCTKTAGILADEELSARSGTGQILNVGVVPVAAYPKAISYTDKIHGKYVFVLYYDGYRISLHTNENLDDGIALVKELLDFERNAKMEK